MAAQPPKPPSGLYAAVRSAGDFQRFWPMLVVLATIVAATVVSIGYLGNAIDRAIGYHSREDLSSAHPSITRRLDRIERKIDRTIHLQQANGKQEQP